MSIEESNQLGQFIPLHYHFQMLSDRDRVRSFKTAIESVVKPHHKVVELGSGTGVLSFFAAKQGAHVQAIEYNPALVKVSQHFLEQNGVSDQVDVIEADASQWIPAEPVDVVIFEMLHSALLREKQVQIIEAFRNHHEDKFGKVPIMMPSATLLGVQPVMQNYQFEGYVAAVPLFQSPYVVSEDTEEIKDPAVYQIVDYDKAKAETYTCTATFSFDQASEFNAFRFITKNLLAIDQHGTDLIDWHNQYLVIPTPQTVEVKEGQDVVMTFSYTPGDPIETLSDRLEISIQ